MTHRLHGYDKLSDEAVCEACGRVGIFWKSTGSRRPRMAVCQVSHELDRRLQKLRDSLRRDISPSRIEEVETEIKKIELKKTFLADQRAERIRQGRERSA